MDDGIESLLSGQQFKRLQEKFFSPVMEQFSLSVLDVRILLFLDVHKSLDTARDIVKMHHWTKSHVSMAIEELMERGYLKRQIDSKDRRRVHLIIQPEAEPILVRLREDYQRMNQVLLAGVSEDELKVVTRVARQISENITGCMKQKT